MEGMKRQRMKITTKRIQEKEINTKKKRGRGRGKGGGRKNLVIGVTVRASGILAIDYCFVIVDYLGFYCMFKGGTGF
jgi:hypothetical protein